MVDCTIDDEHSTVWARGSFYRDEGDMRERTARGIWKSPEQKRKEQGSKESEKLGVGRGR